MQPEYGNYWPTQNANASYNLHQNSNVGQARSNNYNPVPNNSQTISNDQYVRNPSVNWSPTHPSTSLHNGMNSQYPVGAQQIWKSASTQESNFGKPTFSSNNHQQGGIRPSNLELLYSIYNNTTWSHSPSVSNLPNSNPNISHVDTSKKVLKKSNSQGTPQIRVKDVFSLNCSIRPSAVSQRRQTITGSNSSTFVSGNNSNNSREYESINNAQYSSINDKRCEPYNLSTQSQPVSGMYKSPTINNNHWPPDKQYHLTSFRRNDNNSLPNGFNNNRIDQSQTNKNGSGENCFAPELYNSQLQNKQMFSHPRHLPQPGTHSNGNAEQTQIFLSQNVTNRPKELHNNNYTLNALLQSNNAFYSAVTSPVSPVPIESTSNQYNMPVSQNITPKTSFANTTASFSPTNANTVNYFPNYEYSINGSNSSGDLRQAIHNFTSQALQHMSSPQRQNELHEQIPSAVNCEKRLHEVIPKNPSGNFYQISNSSNLAQGMSSQQGMPPQPGMSSEQNAPSPRGISSQQEQSLLHEMLKNAPCAINCEKMPHEVVSGSHPDVTQKNTNSKSSSTTQENITPTRCEIPNIKKEASEDMDCDIKPLFIIKDSVPNEQKKNSVLNQKNSTSQSVTPPQSSISDTFKTNFVSKVIPSTKHVEKPEKVSEKPPLFKILPATPSVTKEVSEIPPALEKIGEPKNKKPCLDMPLLDETDTTNTKKNYESRINREKLSLLIEFLEKDMSTVGSKETETTSVTKPVDTLKRKHENTEQTQSRRKLSKKSIVKNKNNEKHMIICHKTPKGESPVDPLKSKPAFLEVKTDISEDSNNKVENSSNCKDAKKVKDKVNEEMVYKSEYSRRDSTKENEESKSKTKKSTDRKTPDKESSRRDSSHRSSDSKKLGFEENVIKTMKALRKKNTHHCMTCDLSSSNDSFWINVVSGELRCNHCLKKMAQKVQKTQECNKPRENTSSSHKKVDKHRKEERSDSNKDQKKNEEKHVSTSSKESHLKEKSARLEKSGSKDEKLKHEQKIIKKVEDNPETKCVRKESKSPVVKEKEKNYKNPEKVVHTTKHESKVVEPTLFSNSQLPKDNVNKDKKPKEMKKTSVPEKYVLKESEVEKNIGVDDSLKNLKKQTVVRPDKLKIGSHTEQNKMLCVKDQRNMISESNNNLKHLTGDKKKLLSSVFKEKPKLSISDFAKEKFHFSSSKKSEEKSEKNSQKIIKPSLFAELHEKTKKLSRTLLE